MSASTIRRLITVLLLCRRQVRGPVRLLIEREIKLLALERALAELEEVSR